MIMERPTVFECYMANRATGAAPALALRLAYADFKRGRLPFTGRRTGRLGHGDVIRAKGRTFVVSIVQDDVAETPWEASDGHGPVTKWTTRDKRPGELVLSRDGGSRRYYDYAEACKIARRDGWNCPPYHVEGETAKQRAARAVMADFKRLKSWCNDGWHYVGVCLFELPRDGVQRDARHVADAAPFGLLADWALWGVESDDYDYHAEVVRDLIREAL